MSAANSNGSAKKVGRPFKKGESGNPTGRPKVAVEVRDLAREHTEEAMATLVEALQDPDSRVRVAAANALLDRGHGKPVQSVTGELKGDFTWIDLAQRAAAAKRRPG